MIEKIPLNTEAIRIILGLIVSIGGMILLSRYWKVHAFISLLLASLLYGIITGQGIPIILSSMQEGFGSLLAQIGLLVVLGSLLGMLLEKSGAMEVISIGLLQLFGARKSIPAMTVIGAIVGIPVFCDSGFIILSRLIPTIATKASVPPASLTLGLSSGLYTTHSLVPPTPGPLAATANLGASDHLGMVILLGMLVSIPVVIISFLLAKRFGGSISTSLSKESFPPASTFAYWKAFLPFVLPILLIAIASLLTVMEYQGTLVSVLKIMGIPVVAISLGIAAALPLIPKDQRTKLSPWTGEAVKDAGVILLITGAGGAFGAVIKGSHIDLILKDFITDSTTQGISFLIIAFVLASVLKTAQGSTTSAMIITSSLLAPVASAAGMYSATDIALLIITIGGGAMTVSHVNDSYFWVVVQFGKIKSDDALRSYTVLSFFQGLTVLLVSVLLFMLV